MINMGFLGRIGETLTKIDENFSNDPHVVGKKYEDYVKTLFSQKWFVLVEQTHSEKVNRERYVESSLNPDFVFRYNGRGGGEFAVECKFRTEASFDKTGKLRIFKPGQLKRYREFSEKRNMPVFVILGLDIIDNEYCQRFNPEEYMFCIPLSEIKYNDLYPSVFEKYGRDPEKNFFWKNGNLS
ncbi:MAG: hypothetical protein JW931_01590 [Methanomicrobiaceae archaeon]|nr:hypothetical protein [Methanomicrobiaceae archaeon]